MFPSAEFLSRPHQPSKEESEAIFLFLFFLWGEKGCWDGLMIPFYEVFLRSLEEDLKIEREREREVLIQAAIVYLIYLCQN